MERTKHTAASALDAEKRAQTDLDRTKKEIELLAQSREELQQQLALETASLRRELQVPHYLTNYLPISPTRPPTRRDDAAHHGHQRVRRGR